MFRFKRKANDDNKYSKKKCYRSRFYGVIRKKTVELEGFYMRLSSGISVLEHFYNASYSDCDKTFI